LNDWLALNTGVPTLERVGRSREQVELFYTEVYKVQRSMMFDPWDSVCFVMAGGLEWSDMWQ